ncbi:PREDICTED: uncharacterized protein KIAA1377 homolog, partial [Tinamus guttatus]|uniref:uncharacterized protein KIAA1377 homolog n=1 Tax=Tinamus guttatus TaxID=94827 RepID=UPI00052E8360
NFHQEVKKVASSESLSSLDSLETGDQNGNYVTSSESSLATRCDCTLYNPEKSQTRNSSLLYIAENASSKNRHLNNCLRNIESKNNQNNLPILDPLAKHRVLTLAEHTNNAQEESTVSCRSEQQPSEVSTADKQEGPIHNSFTFLKNIKEKNNLCSEMISTLATDSPVFKPGIAWTVSGEGIQDLIQNQSSEMAPQRRTVSVQTSYQPLATSVILFPNRRCSTDIPRTSCSAHISQKDKNISTVFLNNTSGKMTEKEENIKCINNVNPGSSVFQDILNASTLCSVKQTKNKEDKGKMIETTSLLFDTEKEVELFKSILKKESKYEHSHFKALDMDRRIRFGTQPMSSLRDSLELAKIKKKNAENEKNNQNLRWFDQTHQVIIKSKEKCSEENTSEISSTQLQSVQTTSNAPKTTLSVAAPTSPSLGTEKHQEYPQIPKPSVNAGESDKASISLHTVKSAGSYFAKQAWMISKGEEINSPVSISNSKIHEGSQHKSKAKITSRPRAQSSFMPKNRIGTVVCPQAATKANKILKAQEKILAPHPPSAPLPGNRTGKTVARPACQPLHSSNLQTTNINCNHLNERHVLLEDQVLNGNITENSNSYACTSDLATVILSTPFCSKSKYKPLTKNICSVNSVQANACRDCSVVTYTKRRPVKAENGLYREQIPTAEKTSASRQGEHNAQRECATGILPVTGQNQIFDSCENKHRAFLEKRRKTVASRRWRSTHTEVNMRYLTSFSFSVQLNPIQSAFEPVQNTKNTYESDEVSESTVQFLMAEKLSGTSCAEDEILAAMEGSQPATQPLLPNKAQCRGMSALSMEELRIFQSLDHLDQRLQSVQEAITRNISTSSVLQLISPLVRIGSALVSIS